MIRIKYLFFLVCPSSITTSVVGAGSSGKAAAEPPHSKKARHRRLRDRASLAFFDWFGMDRQTKNLRKAFFYAIFEGRGYVVDFGDGQGAIHGAVARD